jgi:hypothetical protein
VRPRRRPARLAGVVDLRHEPAPQPLPNGPVIPRRRPSHDSRCGRRWGAGCCRSCRPCRLGDQSPPGRSVLPAKARNKYAGLCRCPQAQILQAGLAGGPAPTYMCTSTRVNEKKNNIIKKRKRKRIRTGTMVGGPRLTVPSVMGGASRCTDEHPIFLQKNLLCRHIHLSIIIVVRSNYEYSSSTKLYGPCTKLIGPLVGLLCSGKNPTQNKDCTEVQNAHQCSLVARRLTRCDPILKSPTPCSLFVAPL